MNTKEYNLVKYLSIPKIIADYITWHKEKTRAASFKIIKREHVQIRVYDTNINCNYAT